MREILGVGIGGMIGSVLRYGASLVARTLWESAWPISTFFVNLTGCFAIGALSILAEKYWPEHRTLHLFLVTGILGGFTTFSAFGLETVLLYRNQGSTIAILYAVSSVILGILSVLLGRSIPIN
ncbi:MAG: fluoride efflux transporter CrcB [Bdellovibrionales bacterium]|nr:fluoride efflux transporter CrcB [Bdellovibrionales bacterium]